MPGPSSAVFAPQFKPDGALSCPVSTVGGMSVRLPIGSEAKHLADDRAWPEAALKTTVEHTLMRGLATAGPCFVSGLPRSRSGTSVTGPIVDHEGSPPCAAPGRARPWSSVDAVALLADGSGG